MPHGGADNTQKILDVLADYGIKATFFVVGNWADQHPEQAKAIVDSGCELMNHSNAHDHYNSLTAEQKCSGCQDEQGIRAEEYMRCIMIFYGITARLSYQTMQIGFFRMAPRRSTSAGRDKASTTNKRNCKEFVIQHKFNTKTALCNLP